MSADRRPPRRRDGSETAVLLLAVVTVLSIIGLIMVLSASSVQALRTTGSSWHYFVRQLGFLAAGAVALVGFARIDYRRWQRLTAPLLAVSAGLLLLVLVPGVGVRVAGSSRWLALGVVRIQPSELAKLALVVFAADVLARRADRMSDTRYTMRPVLVVFGFFAALMMLQPDMGTTLVTSCVGLAIMFVAGVPLLPLTKVAGAMGGLALVAARLEPYRWRRMTAFLDPWADAGNTGYQAAQGLVALGTGGVVGIGLGQGRAKTGFLPAAHTDFIYAVIGEELGLVGTLLVAALVVAFGVLGVRAAHRAPDRFGMLLATGLTAWIVGQAFVNIGAVVGLVPITGVPLPFVSAGGSALVIAMAATGILLNIATANARRPRRLEAARVPARSGRGVYPARPAPTAGLARPARPVRRSRPGGPSPRRR
jgi:cell division protein FtsW